MSHLSFRALFLTLLLSNSFLGSHKLYAGPENEAALAQKRMEDYLRLLEEASTDRFLEELYKLQQNSDHKKDLSTLRRNPEVLRVINRQLNQIARYYNIPKSYWDDKDALTAENLEDLRFNSKFPGFWYGLRARRLQRASTAADWLAAAKMYRPRTNVEWQNIYEEEKLSANRFFELNPSASQLKEFFAQPIRSHSNWVNSYADYRKNKDGVLPHFGKLRSSFVNHPDFRTNALKADSPWADYGELPHHAFAVATDLNKELGYRFEALDYLLSRPRAEDGNFLKALESIHPLKRIEYLKRHAALSENAWSHNILFELSPKIAHLVDFKNSDAAEIAKFSPFKADESQTNRTNATESDVALWDLASKRDFGTHRKKYPAGLVKAEKHIRESTGKALQLHDAAMQWMSTETYTEADLAEKVAFLNSYTTYSELSADKAQRKNEILSKLSDSTIYRFMLNVVHSNDFLFNYHLLFHDMLGQIDSPEKAEPWLSQFMDSYLKDKTGDYTKRFGGDIKWSQILKNEKLKEYLIKKYPTLLSEDGPHSLLKLVARTTDYRSSSKEVEALRAIRNGNAAVVATPSSDSTRSVVEHAEPAEPVRNTATTSRPLAHRILGERLGSIAISCIKKLRGK